MVPASMVPLRRSAYALPVTPQMLLLAAQHLSDGAGAGAGADVAHYVRYVSSNFPVVLQSARALEADVRRKLVLCVNAGVLEATPPPDETQWCSKHPPGECKYKPAEGLREGRLDRARLRRFWTSAVCSNACGCACVKRRRATDMKRTKHPWMSRMLHAAHAALNRLEERLSPEDEESTQTDSTVTDWVDPKVADGDYCY